MPGNLSERWWVGLWVAVFAATGLAYSLVVPPFETPDELYHYAFARHLAQGKGLPVQAETATGPWAQEGSQAPLYYALVAGAIRWIDQDDFEQVAVRNPRANLGDPTYPGNKNFILYSARRRPLQDTVLAVHVARGVSVLLGIATLLCTYGLARLAFPEDRETRLLALAWMATLPQFAFISASVSNDNVINALAGANLLFMARLAVRPSHQPVRLREWMGLGVLLGLAALGKLHGLGLLVLAGLVVLLRSYLERDRSQLWRGGAAVLGIAGLVAGWWYLRNWLLYGDVLGVRHLLTITGQRTEPLTLGRLMGELRGLRWSFWGLFGWFSVLMPRGWYRLVDGLGLLAFVGAWWALAQLPRERLRPRALLRSPVTRVHLLALTWLLLSLGLMAYWLWVAEGAQGRLLFPALPAFALVFAAGIGIWLGRLPGSWRPVVALALPAGLWLSSLYALTTVLPEAYGQGLTGQVVAQVPPRATPVERVYGPGIELLAVELPSRRFRPGQEVPIVLYMRTQVPLPQDHELFVQLLDPDNVPIGNVTTHPGWGTRPLTLWQPGVIYVDRYQVQLADTIDLPSPILARVYIGFVDPDSTEPESEGLMPVQGGGPKIESRVVGVVEVEAGPEGYPRPVDLRPIRGTWAPGIVLTGYRYPRQIRAGQRPPLPVTLYWETRRALKADYTAFVHLVDPQGAFVATFDQPPAEGRFPTSRWRPGDASLSMFQIPLPPDLRPGTYTLWVGLYPSGTDGSPRVPVEDANRPVQDERIQLGTVEVR